MSKLSSLTGVVASVSLALVPILALALNLQVLTTATGL